MRLLVLGENNMVGHTISIYLKEAGHEIVSLGLNKSNFSKDVNEDIGDLLDLQKVILEGNYDAVINAVSIINQDAEDYKSKATILNCFLPHFLTDITKNSKTRIIHLSTDCIFSGKIGGYSETSFIDGETFYARSKGLGELNNDKDLTLRSSKIGPDINENGIGLFNWFMKQEGDIQGFTKAIWTGVSTITLAKAIERALDENLTGIYNLVNNENISKYELIGLFNKYFKNNRINILPCDKLSADKSLVNNRTDFSFKIPSYEMMVSEMKEWIDNHKELYSHYFI